MAAKIVGGDDVASLLFSTDLSYQDEGLTYGRVFEYVLAGADCERTQLWIFLINELSRLGSSQLIDFIRLEELIEATAGGGSLSPEQILGDLIRSLETNSIPKKIVRIFNTDGTAGMVMSS